MTSIDDTLTAAASLPLAPDGKPSLADRARVELALRAAGFGILRQGRLGVSVIGPAALYERVLGEPGPYAGVYAVKDATLANEVPFLELYPPVIDL